MSAESLMLFAGAATLFAGYALRQRRSIAALRLRLAAAATEIREEREFAFLATESLRALLRWAESHVPLPCSDCGQRDVCVGGVEASFDWSLPTADRPESQRLCMGCGEAAEAQRMADLAYIREHDAEEYDKMRYADHLADLAEEERHQD